MAPADHSFDIVSQVNLQEVANAVEQSKKEVGQRFDFKGSETLLDWNPKERVLILQTENEIRLKALADLLQTRMAKRGVSLRCMEFQAIEKAHGGSVRQKVYIREGIPAEKVREIIRFLKDTRLKLQGQIQEAKVRVQSPKIDTLQDAIRLLRQKDFGIDLQYINYR